MGGFPTIRRRPSSRAPAGFTADYLLPLCSSGRCASGFSVAVAARRMVCAGRRPASVARSRPTTPVCWHPLRSLSHRPVPGFSSGARSIRVASPAGHGQAPSRQNRSSCLSTAGLTCLNFRRSCSRKRWEHGDVTGWGRSFQRTTSSHYSRNLVSGEIFATHRQPGLPLLLRHSDEPSARSYRSRPCCEG